jgi:hypothetical protein
MHTEIFPIHEKCKGCDHTRNEGVETFCKAYSNPSYWWEERNLVKGHKGFWCPMATHLEKAAPEVHKMLNPIKASKRFKR